MTRRDPGITPRKGLHGTTYRCRLDGPPDPETGQRRQLTRTFKRLDDARDWMIRTRHALRERSYAEPSAESLGAFLVHWLATRPDLASRSRAIYAGAIRNHIAPTLGAVPLGQLSGRQVQTCYTALAGTSHAQTVAAVLGQALDLAVREGLVTRNVARGLQVPRRPRAEDAPPQTWTAAQLAAFLAAVPVADYPLFRLLAATGLRLGEALGLTWDDLDLPARALTVRGATKTPASRRRIALDAGTVEALGAQRGEQARRRRLLADDWVETGRVFDRGDGRPLGPERVERHMDATLRDLPALPRLTPHGLRHTHGSLLAAARRPLHYVQSRLGHGSLATTSRYYLHVVPGTEVADAALFAEILAAGEAPPASPARPAETHP